MVMGGIASKIKNKLGLIASMAVVAVTAGVSQVNAFLVQSGAVTLENGDVTVVTSAGTAGLTTMFEGLKLLGVVVLVSGGAWLVSKAFNAVAGMFSSGNK